MKTTSRLTRGRFIKAAALGAAATGANKSFGQTAENHDRQQIPLKIGIRSSSMKMVGDFDVVKTAASIPGIMGVELHVTSGKINLRDMDAVRRYKREANRWGLRIQSLTGVWDRGVKIRSAGAVESLTKSIRAAELLGSNALLVAFFRDDAPDMTREESFGPIVAMLQETAKTAAVAGVALALENSLSPADNKKLVDLVDHPAVGVYYDAHNMAFYGHGDQAVAGIRLLGKERIRMVHVKNEDKLVAEPGLVDWPSAFREFNAIGYDGWYVYETKHKSTAACIEDTKKNNAFLKKHVRMPRA